MPSTTTDARARYLDLIEATLRHALPPRIAARPQAAIGVEFALPAIASLMDLDVPIRDIPSLDQSLDRVLAAALDGPIVDGAGQVRSTYRPLLIRAISPFIFPRPARGVESYVEGCRPKLVDFARGSVALQAADGSAVAGVLFDSLACRATRRIDAPTCAAPFARVIASQGDDGTFLTRAASDQLEPAWYHELAVLHAVDQYARQSGDVTAHEAAKRSARYHAAEVQPDHASSHPFGLAALLDDDDGIHLADMMLHAAGVQQPATMDAVSLVLLFDALDCGRRAQPA